VGVVEGRVVGDGLGVGVVEVRVVGDGAGVGVVKGRVVGDGVGVGVGVSWGVFWVQARQRMTSKSKTEVRVTFTSP